MDTEKWTNQTISQTKLIKFNAPSNIASDETNTKLKKKFEFSPNAITSHKQQSQKQPIKPSASPTSRSG